MYKIQHPNYQRFEAAFFATASEQNLHFPPRQKARVRRVLKTMPHLWRRADRFNQIRNAEELAVNWVRSAP